jgi:predicted kinase
MATLTITVGIPGCGKSFYADAECAKDWTLVRVERDEIRFNLSGSRRDFTREAEVTSIAYRQIAEALESGFDVIVSDTNIRARYRNDFRKFATVYDAEFREIWFDTDVEECVRRDALRPDPVGEEIIREMARNLENSKASTSSPSCTFSASLSAVSTPI